MGFRVDDEVEVLAIMENELYPADSIWNILPGICRSDNIEFKFSILGKPGRHLITIIIDPNNKIIDVNRQNNIITFSFDVFSQELLPLEPLAYWDMSASNPVFRFINPSDDKDLASYEFRILSESDTSYTLLKSNTTDITDKENYIEWTPEIQLQNGTQYWISAVAIYDELKKSSSRLFIPFRAKDDFKLEHAEWSQKNIGKHSEYMSEGLISANIDGKSSLLLGEKKTPYEVLSVHGGGGIQRDVAVIVNNKYYITSPPHPVGFNILVLDSLTLLPKYNKHFDTYHDSSSSERMVYFLRDSVELGDYILLGLCDESFKIIAVSGRSENKVGSWDTISTELRKFGSVLCDSIKPRDYPYWWSWGYSFALVGIKGAEPGTAIEKLDILSDTAFVSGDFVRYDPLGSFSTNTIGPAKKWNSISIEGLMPENNANTTIDIIGISREDFQETKLLSVSNEHEIDISQINTLDYPYIKIKITLRRSSGESNPRISGIICDFEPTPELAIIKSKSSLSDESIMRGEAVSFHYEVENISPRQFAEESVMLISIESENSVIEKLFQDVNTLPQSETAKIDSRVATNDFANENVFSAVINTPELLNEIYYFNNDAAKLFLGVFEDTTPPWIEMYLDGVLAENGMFVARQPKVELRIFDDSRLPLENIQYIEIRINGAWVELEQDMLSGFGSEISEKSFLTFHSDSLEYGENLYSIKVRDMTGNTGIFDYRVFVSQNGFIRNMNNYPNPFESSTTFKFEYKAPQQGAKAIMSIYNTTGQSIRVLEKEISIGNNEICWDGKDSYGNALPTGAYFYMLRIETDIYVESVTGNALLVK